MSDEAETPAAPADKPAKAAGPSKILPILMVLNLGASGAGIFLQTRQKPVVIQQGEGHGEAHAEKEPAVGPVATLDPFVVNLNESGTSRYLKATFEVELTSAHAAEELEKGKRIVRDEILRYLSGLSVADTLGTPNKDRIQTDIVARVDKQLGGGRVKRIYFTDFVVQ